MTHERTFARIPYDAAAERVVIAAMVTSSAVADRMAQLGTASMFYSPLAQAVFDSVVLLRESRTKPEVDLILRDLDARGLLKRVGGEDAVRALMFDVSTASAERYMGVVAECALQRDLQRICASTLDAIELGEAGAAVRDRLLDDIAGLDAFSGEPHGFHWLSDLLVDGAQAKAPWVVPGMLRQDWRAVIVAVEGAGKTLLLQQIGICAAYGIHPLSFTTGHRPVRTLLIDVENPMDRITDGCRQIVQGAGRIRDHDYVVGLLHRTGGIDLRKAQDRRELTATLDKVQPELVCLGPSYKLADRQRGEGWDESARVVQNVLDDLRTRYGFALILEDHAPQGDGRNRELRPFGSSMWLRWPELGIKLLRKEGGAGDLVVDHYRYARMQHGWPDEVHRGRGGNGLPWVGYWRNGIEQEF